MYKVRNNLSPQIMTDMFQFRTNRPNTRNDNEFWVPMPKTTNYGSESVKYLGPKIWNILPKVLKD